MSDNKAVPKTDHIVAHRVSAKMCMDCGRAAAVSAALVLAACVPVDVDRDAAPGQATAFEPPHLVMAIEGVSETVFVRGNLYTVSLRGRGAGQGVEVSAALDPMFSNVAVPNAADAAAAARFSVERRARVECSSGDLTFRSLGREADAATGRQVWVIVGEC